MISGIDVGMNTLHLLSDAKSRSICAENPTGERGMGGRATEGTGANFARDLGQGWKISPSLWLPPKETTILADIHGSGAIKHIWLTVGGPASWRDLILRMYWDGMEDPAVEVPVGDFFASGLGEYAPITSLAVCVNPAKAFNCYWTMPYATGAKITLENRHPEATRVYYQIDYVEAEPEPDFAYFCASYRQSKPTEGGIHTVIDGIKGRGQYVGTYMTWQTNNTGWWGEGEMKFYLDGDGDFPTICGTGTEDYFCGAWDFEVKGKGYTEFCTPYSGLPQVLRPDGLYRSQTRFGMYRWHVTDPIRFERDLRVTVQDLGWHSEGRYLVQKSFITSVAYWYQTLPLQKLAPLGGRDEIELV